MSLRSLVEDSFSENDSSDESFILTKENAELSDKNLNDESSSDDSGSDREGDNENPDEKSPNEAQNEYLNESDRTKKREAKSNEKKEQKSIMESSSKNTKKIEASLDTKALLEADFSNEDSSDEEYEPEGNESDEEEEVLYQELGQVGESSRTQEEEQERKRKMDDIWNQMNEPQSKRQRGSSLQQQPLKKFEGNGKGRDVFVAETETEYVHNTDKSINDTAQDDKPDDIVSKNGASDIGNDNSHNNIGQSHCNSKSVLPERKAKIKYVRPVSKFSQIEAEVERVFGSKKKLNMVEKSKLQWDEYIKKEGIEDKLKHYNKDGYVEKTEFLARSNERQYEAFRSLSKK